MDILDTLTWASEIYHQTSQDSADHVIRKRKEKDGKREREGKGGGGGGGGKNERNRRVAERMK